MLVFDKVSFLGGLNVLKCSGLAGKAWISSEEAAKHLHLGKALLYTSVVPVAPDAMTVDSNPEANSLR